MERTNYQYYENNLMKDQNQSGQGAKMGKKTSYKYYKGGSNKNNSMNQEDKNSTNTNDHHYRNPRRKNFPDNLGPNTNFKKKNKKKRDNNEYTYQGSNAIEINSQSKEEFIDQQNNMNIAGNNNHQNMYNKQYKKNQGQNIYNNNLMNNNINSNLNSTIGSLNTNPNSSNNSNLSNVNLTPQGKNQITTPIGFNMNPSNSPLNNMMPQQNTNQKMYINPKIILGNMRNNLISENEQDLSLKDEKSSENMSEETLSTGRNLLQNQNSGNMLDMNKNQNEFISDIFINNNKFIQQKGNCFPMPYNMNNNINNNLENMNNINNNFNNLQNISNYNHNIANQLNNTIANINNLNLNNLSLNNLQRQLYDNQNNKIFNTPQMKQNFAFPNNEEMNMNHKKIQSPIEQNNLTNPSMNLGNLINLNYNGQNTKFIKTPSNNMNMNINNNNNKMSLSSQGPKNIIPPNFSPAENLNLIASQSQQIPPILNMNLNPLNNINFYVPQNMRNSAINGNYINNNHLNVPNNMNNKDFHNLGFNHNNMVNNNKKYPKQYNYNTYQVPNHINNNNNNKINNQMYNKNNKFLVNNDLNQNRNNYNLNNNNNSGKNYNLRVSKDSSSNSNSNKNNLILNNNNNQQIKQYILYLNLKLGNNKTELIKIKSIEDLPALLKELKENQNISEKVIKLIQNKIYEAIDIKKSIYNYVLDKYTYKNLCEIKNRIGNNKERKRKKKLQKINSMKIINNKYKEEMNLTKNDLKNSESLNLSLFI